MSGVENEGDAPQVDHEESPQPVSASPMEMQGDQQQDPEPLTEQQVETEEPQVPEQNVESVEHTTPQEEGPGEVIPEQQGEGANKAGTEDSAGSQKDVRQSSEGTVKPSGTLVSERRRASTPLSELPISDTSDAKGHGPSAHRGRERGGSGHPRPPRGSGHGRPESSLHTLPPLPASGGDAARAPLPLAPRSAHSGGRSTRHSRPATRGSSGPSGALTPLQNPYRMRTGEEYELYRRRNNVHVSYKGPVHVVEDMHVSCASCGQPVDPVTRVPAGKLFFHPTCIRCCLCGNNTLTDVFFQAMGPYTICSECAVRGFSRCVPNEVAKEHGMVLGANRRKLMHVIKRHDRPRQGEDTNYPAAEGTVPPTLLMGPLHNRKNSTRRSLALIERQRYYSQNDNNIYFPPAVSSSGNTQVEINFVPQLDAPS